MFPYIREIQVNNCYTYQNFKIEDEKEIPFSHFVLTGKNGSGKTTILKKINLLMGLKWYGMYSHQVQQILKDILQVSTEDGPFSLAVDYELLKDVELKHWLLWTIDSVHLSNIDSAIEMVKPYSIYSFFEANRKPIVINEVKSVTKNTEIEYIEKTSSREKFTAQFKQFLVNKRVQQAFDQIDGKNKAIKNSQDFFTQLEKTLQKIYNDNGLKLEFVQENFEFYLNLSDGQKLTFSQLSDGFSSFLSILMDLLVRTDLIRKQKQDFTYNPPGIVLIDEPETHLHLEMQYEIMPLLTNLFPNIQFIVATHSPAVISSIKNALIFDITTKEKQTSEVLGKSFSELMLTHFGLDNEFGPEADNLLESIDKAYNSKNPEKLKQLADSYKEILTPTLRVQIESRIAMLESKKVVND